LSPTARSAWRVDGPARYEPTQWNNGSPRLPERAVLDMDYL
jgi:hypothetical protein